MEQAGEPIAGSLWTRGFCARCGEPMRIKDYSDKKDYYCEECDPPRPPPPHAALTLRQRHGLTRTSS